MTRQDDLISRAVDVDWDDPQLQDLLKKNAGMASGQSPHLRCAVGKVAPGLASGGCGRGVATRAAGVG